MTEELIQTLEEQIAEWRENPEYRDTRGIANQVEAVLEAYKDD